MWNIDSIKLSTCHNSIDHCFFVLFFFEKHFLLNKKIKELMCELCDVDTLIEDNLSHATQFFN